MCVGTLSFVCCEKKPWLAKLERSNKDSSARYIAFSLFRQLELGHSFCHFFNLLEEAKGVSNPFFLIFASFHHMRFVSYRGGVELLVYCIYPFVSI